MTEPVDWAARLERLSEDIADFTDSMNNEDGYFSMEDADLLRAAAAELRRLRAAAALALEIAEGWIYSELHGTSHYASADAALDPVRAALAATRPTEE